jgi:glutamyl-tRNA synthetase
MALILIQKTRFVPGATKNMLEMLEWAGIRPDEGPTYGGDFGPYIQVIDFIWIFLLDGICWMTVLNRQSERIELYTKHAMALLKRDKAYRCFCSPETLDAQRQASKKSGHILPYDRRCRSLSENQISANLTNGMPFTIRLKVSFKL